MKPSLLSQQKAGSVHTCKHLLYCNSKIRSLRKRHLTAQEESKQGFKGAPFPETSELLSELDTCCAYLQTHPLKLKCLKVLWLCPSQAKKSTLIFTKRYLRIL